jgi:hypothetical protein
MKNGRTKPRKSRPSPEAIAAAKRLVGNTKAELLDIITGQHKTILLQTAAMGMIGDANALKLLRLKMVILLRRQLERRLRVSIGELLEFFEGKRPAGYVHSEMARIAAIRELAL